MELTLDLGAIDDVVLESTLEGVEYLEFCDTLNYLSSFLDQRLYLEARVDDAKTFGDKMGDAFRNTANTTKDVGVAYDKVTDGGGVLAKSVWDLMMTAIKFSVKVLSFVLKNIAKIPRFANNTFKKIGRIPKNIRDLIKGNIKLYIAAQDLQYFYNTIFPNVRNFLSLAKGMSEGEVWGTFWKGDASDTKNPKQGAFKSGRDDMAIYKSMKEISDKLRKVRFELSTIEMGDQGALDTYFGDSKSISFKDISGRTHQSSYREALAALSTELTGNGSDSLQTQLEDIQKMLSEKLNVTQGNQEFANLKSREQQNVKNSILMVSEVVRIVGDFVRYIFADISALDKAATTVLMKRGVNPPVQINPPSSKKPKKKEEKA